VKSHVDARNERERLQEAHEQKMHFLHEFHRQQLHAKDHEIRAKDLEVQAREERVSKEMMERRARVAEERLSLAGMAGREWKGVERGLDGWADGAEKAVEGAMRVGAGTRRRRGRFGG
jgi:hypothetical protein